MHLGKLIVGKWDKSIFIPTHWSAIIMEQEVLSKCILDGGHIKLNGVALKVSGKSLYVHLEKTRCNECGHEHKWCAIPQYAVGDKSYLEFVAGLDILRCLGCGKKLRHGVRVATDTADELNNSQIVSNSDRRQAKIVTTNQELTWQRKKHEF